MRAFKFVLIISLAISFTACKKCRECRRIGTENPEEYYDMGEVCGKDLREIDGEVEDNGLLINPVTGQAEYGPSEVVCKKSFDFD